MKVSLVIMIIFNLLITVSSFGQKTEMIKPEFEKPLSYYSEQIQKKTPESNGIEFIQGHAKLINKLAEDSYLQKSSTFQYWISNGWQNSYQTLYTYTPQNKVDLVITQRWNGTVRVNDLKTDYDYINTSGSSDLDTRYSWDGSSWIPRDRYIYTYDFNTGKGQWLMENYTNSAWVPFLRYIYEFDQGRVSSYIEERYNNQTWKANYKYSIKYLEGTNKTSEQLTESWANGEWVNSAKQVYLYNSGTNVIEYAYFSYTNQEWVEKWRYLFRRICR